MSRSLSLVATGLDAGNQHLNIAPGNSSDGVSTRSIVFLSIYLYVTSMKPRIVCSVSSMATL